MALKRRHPDKSNYVRLTACPVCPTEFDSSTNPSYHIEKHDPEDFGLSPLGETEKTGEPEP